MNLKAGNKNSLWMDMILLVSWFNSFVSRCDLCVRLLADP
jgi:hypothetical protein